MSRKKMIITDKKTILTININNKLINRIDTLNDKLSENRSRLISKLLEEYVEENKNKIDE